MRSAGSFTSPRRRLLGIASGAASAGAISLVLAACATSNETTTAEDAGATRDAWSDDALGAGDAAPDSEEAPVPCVIGNLCRVPSPMASGTIISLNGRSLNDVWASASGATLFHWDGQVWNAIDTGIYDTLSNLFVTPDEVWGISGELLWRRADASGTSKSFRVRAVDTSWRALSGVAVLSNTDVYISMLPSKAYTVVLQPLAKVADFDGQLLEFPPEPVYTATQRTQPTRIQSLSLVPNRALWLVGDLGVVIRYRLSPSGDLELGEILPSPSQELLFGSWGYGDHLWAVGEGGTILHFDGSRWTKESTGTSATLRAVFGFDANDVWVVGARGTVLHYDGATWTKLPVGKYEGLLTSIWGASPNDIWIGGENTVLHWGALR